MYRIRPFLNSTYLPIFANVLCFSLVRRLFDGLSLIQISYSRHAYEILNHDSSSTISLPAVCLLFSHARQSQQISVRDRHP